MNDNNLSSILDKATDALAGNAPLGNVFSGLRQAASILSDKDLSDRIKALETRYFYLLRFVEQADSSFSAAADTDEIRHDIESVLALAVNLAQEADNTAVKGPQLRFQRRRPEENIESLVSDFLSEQDRLRTDPLALTDSHARAKLEQLASDIFKRIWATDPLQPDEEKLIGTLINDKNIPTYYREHIVHAIGLGMERNMPLWRMNLLENAMTSNNSRISVAAEVWIVLAVALSGRKVVPGTPLPHIADIYHALMRNMAPAVNPGMGNLMSLGRKMQDNPLDVPDMSTDEYESIRRFSEAQSRGEDVFAATLGKMRQFPFFNDMANWFLPFHSDHSALADIVDGEGAAVADIIERMPVVTDGDKFALVLSMSMMPAEMRARSLSAMVDNIRQMSDSEEFRLAMESAKPTETMIAGQCVATINRFFTGNADGKRMALANDTKSIVRNMLHLLPEGFYDYTPELDAIDNLCKHHEYQAAMDIYSLLPENVNVGAETLCNLAQASAKLNMSDEPADFYRRALKVSPGMRRAVIGLARLNAEAGNIIANIALMEPFAADNADNDEYLLLLGNAYLAGGKTDKAVETFHNLDYISENDVAKEPLAWALTLAGDYDNAALFFAEAMQEHISPKLFARNGIRLWLAGDRREALQMFEKAAGAYSGNDFAAYLRQLASATGTVGIKADLPLAAEIIRYRKAQK